MYIIYYIRICTRVFCNLKIFVCGEVEHVFRIFITQVNFLSLHKSHFLTHLKLNWSFLLSIFLTNSKLKIYCVPQPFR